MTPRVAVVIACVCSLSLPASAQDKTFTLDRLSVAGGPEDAIGLWRPGVAAGTHVHGQAGAGFALNPLRVENHIRDERDAALLDQASGPPVSTQLIGYFDVGVQFLGRFDLGVELPVVAAQTGNSTSAEGVDAPDNVDLASTALMDVRLQGRASTYRSPSGAFEIGVDASVWIPTGNVYSFAGDDSVSGGFGVSAEVDLRSVFLVVNTGVHLRPRGGVNDLIIGSEWRWGTGAFVPLARGAVRVGAEVFGSTGITGQTALTAANTPLEWMLEGRLATDRASKGWVGLGAGTRLSAGYAPDVRAVALAGYSFGIEDASPRSPSRRFGLVAGARQADSDDDGYADDIDLCPSDPEDGKPPNPSDGCPALADRDVDGNPDISDLCPDQPEDYDGVRDRDGCPEDDGDDDGEPDAVDACPRTAGERSPIPQRNGCPRYIAEGGGVIRLLQQVQFETGKSRILPESFPILDEVARVLLKNPEIEHVRVEGHTDNRGSDELNEKLSGERAASVMRYLVEQGVAAFRLSAQGFGPKLPIADNDTADGRRRNRRVEFTMMPGTGAR